MKIKYSLLLKWCNCNLTNKELDFLLFIVRYQDQDGFGQVRGIYYKDIMKKCKMSQGTFYNVLKSLERKGLIAYKSKKHDYDIIILNNSFSYKGSLNEGYINLNKIIFDEKRFNKLRVKEKLLLMLFMRNTHVNKGLYRIGKETFCDEYTKVFGVTKKVLRSYLHSLKKIFYILAKEGKYFVKFVASTFKEKVETEVDQYLDHIVRIGCRRNNIDPFSPAMVKDTLQLVKQYRKEARGSGQDIFDVLDTCLAECKKGVLNSKYIHKLMRQVLGIEHRPVVTTEF